MGWKRRQTNPLEFGNHNTREKSGSRGTNWTNNHRSIGCEDKQEGLHMEHIHLSPSGTQIMLIRFMDMVGK